MFKNNTSDLNIKYLKLEITNCLMEIEHRKMDFLKSQLHSPKLSDLLKLRMSNEILWVECANYVEESNFQKAIDLLDESSHCRVKYLLQQQCYGSITSFTAASS